MNTMTLFVLIMCGTSLMFYVFGIASESNYMLNLLLNPESMSTSAFWLTLSGAITVGGIAVYLGFINKNVELAAMTAVVPLVVSTLWHFSVVIQLIAGSYPIVSYLVFGPIMILFAMTAIDYWRGRD